MSSHANLSACFQTGPRVSILNLRPSTMTEEQLKKKAAAHLRNCDDPIERLRLHCLSRGLTTFKNLQRHFISLEGDKESLSVSNVCDALKKQGVEMEQQEVKSICEKAGAVDGQGISMKTFMDKIRPPINKTRSSLIAKTFNAISKNKEFATVEDLRVGFNYKKQPQYLSGDKSKEEVFQQFLKSFDIQLHEDNKVTLEDFVNYYAAVSAGTEADIYFDLVVRNMWDIA
ncbi:calcyphosin-like protein [Ditylenchus destructor]|nr:calcyphosin-like protein [Ditylenchus destructor]